MSGHGFWAHGSAVVASPSFANGAVDCRARVTLSGISFDDLGQTGGSWSVNVAWGDGTSTTYTTSTEGAQPNLTHRYATPGVYTPVVTVTAADGTAVSKASSNAASVRQTYDVDFRGDLEDSEAGDIDVNTIRAGRTVPVKATIYDICARSYVNNPSADVSIVVGLDAGGPATSAGTTQMVWNRAWYVRGGYWQFNLRSTTGTGTPLVVGPLYRTDLFVGDELATRYEWAVLKVRR